MFRDYSNYDVLPDGRIWSKKRNKFLKPVKNRDGYQLVFLYDNEGKRHNESVHKITFFAVNGLWEYPEGMQLNHIDENKENNHISNLELVTRKQNINWGTRNKRIAKALTNHPKKSKRCAAYKDGELVMVFQSTQEAQRNGFCSGEVSACCRGKIKTHKGLIWKYLDEESEAN